MKEMIFSGIIDDYKNKDSIWIGWMITERCNYNCHYCLIDGNKDYDMSIYKDVIDYISKKSKEYKNLKFAMTGGEPSIIKEEDFVRILNYFKKMIEPENVIFRYQTNLSNTVEYYSNLWKILNKFDINISATLHIAQEMPPFREKIIEMSKFPINLDIRIPIPYGYEEESIERYRSMKNLEGDNVKVVPKYILEHGIIEPEIMEFIVQENELMIDNHYDDFIYDVIYIDNESGEITKEKYNRDRFLYEYRDTKEMKSKQDHVICDMSRTRDITPDGIIHRCPIDTNITRDSCVCSKPVRICCGHVPKFNIKHINKAKEILNES